MSTDRTGHRGVDPAVVADAIRMGLIASAEADRFLNPPSPRQPFIVPKAPPPPERLAPVVVHGKRLRRVRARMTRRLLAAHIIDSAVVADEGRAPSPAECDNAEVNGFERMIMRDAENGVDVNSYEVVWTGQPRPKRDRTIPAAPLNWTPPDEQDTPA